MIMWKASSLPREEVDQRPASRGRRPLLSTSLLSLHRRPNRSARLATSLASLARNVVDLRSDELDPAPRREANAVAAATTWHQKVYRSLKPRKAAKGSETLACFLCTRSTYNTGFVVVHGVRLHINCLRCARCQILLEVGDCQIRSVQWAHQSPGVQLGRSGAKPEVS
ncbi:uncharacterized protein LOC119102175 [Pollicipes pollicipes]|uniref:uncharacterized protein LOC119102175 n=1 Tax=Pollicipes pollicipes TaxID=41117 RepID=UPI001884AAE4|nr:uncharacterized protein LOC119102175 [Pollicipes pollicipes]